MTATTMMHIRVDEELKAKAIETLDELGLSVSDAVRIFLKRVVLEEGLPLTLKVPNAKTKMAIAEAKSILEPKFTSIGDLIDDIEKEART